MIWQHHSRKRWLCTDISPLTIEVKALKDGAAWRVTSDAGTFFQGRADHTMTAIEVGTKHALEIAKRYEQPKPLATKEFSEPSNLEISDLEISDLEINTSINPEDVTALVDSPSDSDH